MKRAGTLLGVLFLLTAKIYAQQQGEVKMTASIAGAMPLGQMKDRLTDNTTLRGGDVTILYGVSDKLAIGANLGFQDFYKKYPRAVYKLEDGSDISAVMTNSIQVIPFLATARYQLKNEGVLRPYVSAGLGGALVSYKQFLGEYPNESNKISLAVRPGAGVYIPFRKDGETGLNLGVNYQYMPYKVVSGMSNMSYFGFTVGIGFPMRN